MKKLTLTILIIILVSSVYAHESHLTEEEYNIALSNMQKTRLVKEFTLPFIFGGGLLRENEHAVGIYFDVAFLPPALMLSYQYGMYYWLNIGLDIGGNWGIFQALINIKQEMFRSRKTDIFYLGWNIKTGYKQHQAYLTKNLRFDDVSWVLILDNVLSFRIGQDKKKQKNAITITTEFYWDYDLRGKKIQNDFYFAPATIGYERILGKYGNFHIEAGAVYTKTGSQMGASSEIIYKKSWFAAGKIGFGFRTGDLTAHINNDPKKLAKYNKK